MGPLSVRAYPGRKLVRGREGGLAGRARWELGLDRDRKPGGYVFGAFVPATGEALTATYESRSIVTFVDFLEKVEAWVPESVERVYAIMDNLRAHKAYDVLLFDVAHPRWEFVFQPKYAAYLNLIEPWWKTLRSLALAGRFFETWEQTEEAIEKARDYWNAHRHPFVWGRRRRHRTARRSGVGAMATIQAVKA
jgi:transposase